MNKILMSQLLNSCVQLVEIIRHIGGEKWMNTKHVVDALEVISKAKSETI